MGESEHTGHVFLSYVREDSSAVDRLQELLELAGIRVWRDTTDLWPGEDWRSRIRNAITNDALVFIACFSTHSVARLATHHNEELTLAIEEVRKRPADEAWLIPVRLDDCKIPDRDIGAGRTLHSLGRIDLFGADRGKAGDRLVAAVQRILGRSAPGPAAQVPRTSAPGWNQASPGRAGGKPQSPPAAEPTFGIIAALPAEFTAMRALIDDPQRRIVAADRGDYIVGTMPSLDPARPHHVVLTQLAGMGNDAASSACSNLIRSFESVRCVLMVGTAAGVPRPHEPGRHVRLGDIVVARKGIVEYDTVRESAHGPVPWRTFPGASPLLERRARMLEADELTGRRPWEELIAAAAKKLPGYRRPRATTDVLYASDETDDQIPHPPMPRSGHRARQPKVHSGKIASGDRSFRNARRRDEVANSEPGVLAIEMEGKGIGNTGFSEGVEWLVVRGISDYGDTHADHTWRNYASLVAAAYTTALLAECPPIPSPGSSASLDDQVQKLIAAVGRQPGRGAADQGQIGAPVCSFTSHTRTVLAVEFSPDSSLLATGSEDATARLWDPRTGNQARTLTGHKGSVNSVRFSPDGRLLATGSEDHTARLWRVADGAPSGTLEGHEAAVWKVAFSPDRAIVATASYDHTARLWQAGSGALAHVLTGHDGPVLGIAFSPDGHLLATASEDHTARLWHAGTGSAIATLTGHGGRIWQAAFSPDGQLLATVSEDKTARLWHTATGTPVATLTGHDGDVNTATFSPDGHLLATASEDKTARLWHTATGAPVATLTGHDGDVNTATFSPDGHLLATASQDKTARLWDTATGATITTLTGHASAVWLAAFSPDGSLLATADEDHVVRTWEHLSPQATVRSP